MEQKIKKQNSKIYWTLILLVALLSLAVGYAIFNKSLNINGTAIASGNFNVEFLASSIVSSSGCTPTSTISESKDNLTISVPDLNNSGSGATISVIVKNTGNVAAKLLNVVVTGENDPDITISYPKWKTGIILNPSETYEFNISINWNKNSNVIDKSLIFTATLNYEQNI